MNVSKRHIIENSLHVNLRRSILTALSCFTLTLCQCYLLMVKKCHHLATTTKVNLIPHDVNLLTHKLSNCPLQRRKQLRGPVFTWRWSAARATARCPSRTPPSTPCSGASHSSPTGNGRLTCGRLCYYCFLQ